jgi:hypothetical protein
MIKKLLFLGAFAFTVSAVSAQTAQLYRQASDATDAVTEFTYTTSSGGDKIIYPSALTTSSSNICAPAVRRVQMLSFSLNYKTSSIGKIEIIANSSGTTSSRNLTMLKVNGTDVTSSLTFSSTVLGNSGGGVGYSDCGVITITGLSVPKDAANGVNLEFTFDNNIRLNTINVWSIEALPLDFISFSAKPSALGNTVNLDWKTTNEVNTKNFEVQSRTANTEFKTIGFVDSRNTAGVHNYSFTDSKPLASTVYYRLKQVDNDGKFNYSDIAVVNINSGLSIVLYPNPVSTVLTVNHPNSVNRLTVMNMEGKKVLEKALSGNAISTDINIESLNAGTYIVIAEANGEQLSGKFLKK